MRKEPTPAERLLWRALRSKSMGGRKVRRQVPYGRYILDFYIPSLRLAIEVDGESHVGSATDAVRDAWFESQTIRTLRFWNNEIIENLEGVLAVIQAAISAHARPPPPGLLPQGEEETQTLGLPKQ
jgi:very-short-patch-repair endonuclease